MIVGRENLVELENIANLQRRVYNDACDFGVVASDEITERIRNACKGLSADLKSKASVQRYRGGCTKTWTTFLPIEYSDYEPGATDGVLITVRLIEVDSKRYDNFFEIIIKRDTRKGDFYKEAA